MFAIGHFALGYLTGKGSSKLFDTKLNLPLLLVVSVLPDVDLILQSFDQTLFMHRGALHSIITFIVVMIPFFIIYRKQAIPYYVALLSHSLIGDLPTGGVEMLWPVSQTWFGNNSIPIGSLANVVAEMALFVVATVIMYKIGDLKKLLQPKTRNWILLIAFGAVLGPIFEISQRSDAGLPVLLIPASVFWLILFAYSITKGLQSRKVINK
jgi:membrane-bound metal-dependent hydrolase YbcI (DUF457 family)